MFKTQFKLDIDLIEQADSCRFRLSWGKGKQLTASLDNVNHIFSKYYQWQQAYLNYYRSNFRGRKLGQGGGVEVVNNNFETDLQNTDLLPEFVKWLRDSNLFKIRDEILKAVNYYQTNNDNIYPVEILITCNGENNINDHVIKLA
jgi:hypothetical protein